MTAARGSDDPYHGKDVVNPIQITKASAVDTLIPAPAVRRTLGIGHSTLHRWLNGDYDNRTGKHTPPVADFPKPRVINTRRYWLRSDIERFMAARAA
jgi:predicted DNA-binding transcriptional regulator AlpA